MVARLENASALDPVADLFARISRAFIKPGPLRSVLSGTRLGHPAHPAVMLLPSACWLASSTLDLCRRGKYRAASSRLIETGILAAVPTALTGVNDWLDTAGAERRVGVVHASTNYVGLAFQVASWRARRSGRFGLGVALSLAGNTALLTAGWLGGHLVYARGVGVDTTAFQVVPDEWTDAVAEREVREGIASFANVGGVPVLLTRCDGHVIAMADRCSHRGGPLHEGELAHGRVTCPWHESEFDLHDGTVARGPATRPQHTYAARVCDGRVQVRRAAEPVALRKNVT